MEAGFLLGKLREEPGRAAILLDIDGALAPIVARPEDAAVPDETRRELIRLAARYALVALVTGRTTEDARRIVGLEDIPVVGLHGLEHHPETARWRGELEAVRDEAGWPIEDKGVSISLHYRTAKDEAAARAHLEQVADSARARGLRPRFGRKVLELLPPIDASKGTGITQLLGEHGLRRALYAGDDTTDLDAFRALDELELGVKIAVASAEGPPELREAADLVVDGPTGLAELLRSL